MKRVLHLITGLEKGGGAEHMLLKTLPLLKSAEHAVCAIRGRGEMGARLEEKGVKVFYLQMKNYFDFGVIKRYKDVVKNFSPDIQVNYLIHADVFGRIFGKRFGAKKIVSYIRNRHIKSIFQIFDFLTLHSVDYLLANSEAVLKFYRHRYHFPENRSAAIPNAIDLTPVPDGDLDKLRNELQINEDDLVITTIASLHKQKDLPTFLRAVSIVKEKGLIKPKVFICGQGPEKDNLEELAGVLGLKENVFFLGVRNDVYDILKISGAFVLPSLHEGMSNALLEAMKEGCPCIVSAIPENTELITDKKSGLTFPPGNDVALAEKIMAVAASDAAAKALADEAHKVVARYDLGKIIAELDEFFLARLVERQKIVWLANDRNNIYLNFFRALGESHPELDLFLIAGDREASAGQEKFYRWQVFKFSWRGLFKFIFLPSHLIAKLKGKRFDGLNLDYYRGLHRLLRRENPDLLMANLYLQPTSWQAAWYCLLHRRPFLLLEEKKHLGLSGVRRIMSIIQLILAAPLFLLAKKVYCYTSDGVDFGKKYFPIFNKRKIELLPGSIDTDFFYNQHLAKDDGVLKVYITARLVPFKRHEDLLRALKVIKDRGLVKFILNMRGKALGDSEGDPVFEKEIDNLIDQLGIRGCINFVPPATYEKQVDNFNQNDIFVLPSFNEPIGIVVPEAMACGLPVIISDTCGAKTYIKDGVNGYIFKTFDYFDLAEKIVLLNDQTRRKKMGEAAEQTIKNEFSSPVVAEKFYQSIKDLF
jgi:glycosyltransferase involved in cell wall biosynthesis